MIIRKCVDVYWCLW